jgi:hypothetical protein
VTSEEDASGPFRLAPADLTQVRAHARAIVTVIGGARLMPVAKAADGRK